MLLKMFQVVKICHMRNVTGYKLVRTRLTRKLNVRNKSHGQKDT